MSRAGALELLRGVRERLTPDRAWTLSAFARRTDGYVCSPHDPRAVCWCLVGAVLAQPSARLDGDEALSLLYGALVTACAIPPPLLRGGEEGVAQAVANWNDNSTKADVLALLDAVIAAEAA